MLHPTLTFHQQTDTPLNILECFCRDHLVGPIRKVIAVIVAAIHRHDCMGAIYLIHRVAVLIRSQLCSIYHCLCHCHRLLFHKGLKGRELLFHHSVNLCLQLAQGDMCVESHLLCSLCRACCHLAECHLRLMDLHHTYSTVDCYCSSHHVDHCFVLSPGLLGGKDTEAGRR